MKHTDHTSDKCHCYKNYFIGKEILFHRLKVIVVGEDFGIFGFFSGGLVLLPDYVMEMPFKF